MAKSKQIQVDSIRHKDKRTNIPTEELRDFVAEDEQTPKKMLYPRDPSLDPQLVWKGKDEQDQKDLDVPVVPIYIQEKIHPQAIIDSLPKIESEDNGQVSLFGDFNGGPKEFDQKVEFYQHEQNWTNRMILGDSLLVMTSLAEKERLKGKVQTIYMDPPYGIKFGSNWQVSTRKRDVKDGKAEDATRQPEQIKAFRDTWELGIHSYLAYLRDRLVVARDLLTETGSVFVQIGDENVHLVRSVMDEVFGSENFISLITVRTKIPLGTTYLAGVCDYILWFGKSKLQTKYRKLFLPKHIEPGSQFNLVDFPNGEKRSLTASEMESPALLPEGSRVFTSLDLSSSGRTESCVFPFEFNKKLFNPTSGKSWKTNLPGMNKLVLANRLYATANALRYVLYHEDFPVMELPNIWGDAFGSAGKIYIVQTNELVIQRCLLMTTDPGDLVLDPTCGSGTTAFVAEQWGRRWITCDTSRVALALARTRMMSAKYPFYLLSDSEEGIKKEMELTGKVPPPYRPEGDIRKGFVYERVPHVTLGSIANNPDIKEGMTRQEINAAIARHADTELLYDKPYMDTKRLRVTGPFSVESLSPHRVLSTADENWDGTVSEQESQKQQDFTAMILDNLKKAGIQNSKKGERLQFDRLDVYPGTWIHATGEYSESDGKTKRVAVTLGPEHGTVGPNQIKEAAKEAVQGIGFDLLVVCGFAFDPHVSEEIKRYGKLTVLPTKMNPDLAMGDELLKKTGSGNLFMVFGEPDIEIVEAEGKIVVSIHGLDVYDPTTGQIRSSSVDDLACWFIDTDYNGESFFVRHAYFTGSDYPYNKLKKALKANIDEAAWESLYSSESRPFDKPKTGRIAVKAINHYGDEILKVFEIR